MQSPIVVMIRKIIYLGVERQQDFVLRSIIAICNGTYLFALFTTTVTSLFYIALGYWHGLLTCLFGFAVFSALLTANKFQAFTLSRIASTLLGNLCIIVGLLQLGEASGLHFFAIAIIVYAFVIFRSYEFWFRVFSLLPSLALLSYVELFRHTEIHGMVALGSQDILYLRALFLLATVMIIGGLVMLQSFLLERYRSLLERDEQKRLYHSRLTALGEMSAGIAHEINNPLTSIAGRAEIIEKIALSSDPAQIAKIQKLAQDIHKNSFRIHKIVEGLRSFSKQSNQDLPEIHKLSFIIEETLALCQQRLSNEQIELRLELPKDDLLIQVRPYELVQVLLNLLLNSMDALNRLEHRIIQIKALVTPDQQIELQIRDSGPGISRSHRDKVFQPFFTTKSLGEGTGLGLSIAKGIIEDHQGQLEVVGYGASTCFVIRLPQPNRTTSKAG